MWVWVCICLPRSLHPPNFPCRPCPHRRFLYRPSLLLHPVTPGDPCPAPSSYTCNTGGDFSFGNDFVWYSGFSSGAGGINVLRSLNNAHLWWDGDNRDLRGVNACWWAWQCTWRLQAP